ncbi:MAG: hypothetical protein MUF72_10240, partial [Elainella sp. Prado103]|nr:hypothetical protein [Elainella sp. Prado103]
QIRQIRQIRQISLLAAGSSGISSDQAVQILNRSRQNVIFRYKSAFCYGLPLAIETITCL